MYDISEAGQQRERYWLTSRGAIIGEPALDNLLFEHPISSLESVPAGSLRVDGVSVALQAQRLGVYPSRKAAKAASSISPCSPSENFTDWFIFIVICGI